MAVSLRAMCWPRPVKPRHGARAGAAAASLWNLGASEQQISADRNPRQERRWPFAARESAVELERWNRPRGFDARGAPPGRAGGGAGPSARGPSGTAVEKSDRFLELLGGPEGDLLARLDLDGLARGGIAPHARRALPDLEDAEPADANAIPFLEMPGEQADEIAEHGLGLLLGHAVILGELRSQMLQRDRCRRGSLCGRFGRHCCRSPLLVDA